MTDDADIRMAQSMMDYIFRRLALDYLPFESRSSLGLYTSSERARALETGTYTEDVVEDYENLERTAPITPTAPLTSPPKLVVIDNKQEFGSSTELMEALSGVKADAPLCMTCGVKMRMSGACYVCEGCGNTSGCS